MDDGVAGVWTYTPDGEESLFSTLNRMIVVVAHQTLINMESAGVYGYLFSFFLVWRDKKIMLAKIPKFLMERTENIYVSTAGFYMCSDSNIFFFHLFSIPCVQRSFYTCTYDGPTLEPILMQIHGNYFWQNKHHAEIYCTCSAYIYVCMANTHNTYSSRTSTWCLNIWSKNVYDKIIWRSVMACFLASDCWSCVISSFDTYSTYRCVKASGSLTGFNVMSRNVCGKCHHIRDNLSRIKQVSFRYHFRIVQAQNEYFFSFIQVTSVAGKNSIAMLYLALSSRTYFFCQWNNSRMNK